MVSLDAIIQDGHHHALPGVAPPPGLDDGERRQAAGGAVLAPLRSKERDAGLSGEWWVDPAPSAWVSGSGSSWSEQGEGEKKPLTGNQVLPSVESLRSRARARPDWRSLAESTWRILGILRALLCTACCWSQCTLEGEQM